MKQLEDTATELASVKDRLSFVETQVNSYLSFGNDPFIGMKVQNDVCQKSTILSEYCTGDYKDCVDQKICLDHFPPTDEPCIIYDFGIRQEPEFGQILSQAPFNCKVFAFDPSPITQKWYATNKELRNNPNYRLFHYGAGGADETVTLYEYNWDQVTILKYPDLVVDPTNCDENDACKYKRFTVQAEHSLPVRSLPSIMAELGHKKVTIVKLDVEGSEYRFLETMITSGACLNVDQLTLEWHHYDYDWRYGVTSSPHINVLVTLLKERCGLEQYWIHDDTGGWPANDKIYTEMKIKLMYNLAAFARRKVI